MAKDNPERRKRRDAKEIEEALFKATEVLVAAKGFDNVLITEIMELADVEPTVVYKRFKNIDDLFDKFIRQYDYWFLDIVKSKLDESNPAESMKGILTGLVKSLYENPVMQSILIWELSDSNDLTSRTAINRELHSKSVLTFFRQHLIDDVDFNYLTSVIIGGIYYLILHKNISTFCGIDFTNKESEIILAKTVEQIIDQVYGPKTKNGISPECEKIVISLLEENVDMNIIAKSTGLSLSEIKKLNKRIMVDS